MRGVDQSLGAKRCERFERALSSSGKNRLDLCQRGVRCRRGSHAGEGTHKSGTNDECSEFFGIEHQRRMPESSRVAHERRSLLTASRQQMFFNRRIMCKNKCAAVSLYIDSLRGGS